MIHSAKLRTLVKLLDWKLSGYQRTNSCGFGVRSGERQNDETIVVFDLGGGTFDVSAGAG